jgi:predicted NAD/FAD-binding protein
MKIAIVGTGIAGLSASYLLSRAHDVVVLDANDYVGGHTNTVDVEGHAIDTGFIVHNRRNYPLLTRLFDELGVATQPAVMSFSMECACGVAWSSRRPWTAGAALREIVRFLRTAGSAESDGKTLAEFVRDERYSDAFLWHYLVPMTSALWSTAPGDALRVPAVFAIEFFRNHGMLGLRREQWRTVVGGSREYVRLLMVRSPAALRLGNGVVGVTRTQRGVELSLADGAKMAADAVVLATSAPTALDLLETATPLERRLLAPFDVTRNQVVLHSDVRLLPVRPALRAAWNYRSAGCGTETPLPNVSYSMNRLQRLDAEREWCVTLNRTEEIDPASIARVIEYTHPRVTFESLAAQPRLAELNTGVTAFAGAWQGYGFHEDGIRSGVAAAAHFGVTW